MKLYNIYSILYWTAILLAIASCSKDEQVSPADTEPGQLGFISITDEGYASVSDVHNVANASTTRSVDNGYTTEFTAGDACGLYMVRGGKVIYPNVKLTAERDADTGSLVWKPDGGTTLAGGLPDEHYYLYYPYQASMDGKTASFTGNAPTDEEFFAPLIASWQQQEDQSTYANYTKSDLMTAKGIAVIGANNTFLLSFSMTHRMALAVIEMPKTVYKFTDARISDYTIPTPTVFSGSAKPLWGEAAYRYLTNPNAASFPTMEGSYDNGSKEFTITPSGLAAGSYKKYKVDGAVEKRKNYTIQRGDFLLANGHLLPKETSLTEGQKASVAAIVFWTPAETDPAGRQTPASLTDDKIMSKDYPSCTHGLAVAVQYKTKVIYQRPANDFTADDFILNFQNGSGFSRADKSDFAPIATLNKATDNMNRILGYQNTQVLLAYNDWCRATGRGTVATIADELKAFASKYSAPVTSTGWYIPSIKELYMLCYKDIDDIWYAGRALRQRETADIVRNSYLKIYNNIDFLADYHCYWSSTECRSIWDALDLCYTLDFLFSYPTTAYKAVNAGGGAVDNFMSAVCAF